MLLELYSFQQLRDRITDALADTARLPARQQGRAKLSPALSYGRHFGPPVATARAAAVMIMLMPYQGTWSVPLTMRSSHLPEHPSQISLPGGRLELGETPVQAAEREFVEELGCEPFPGHVLGELLPLYVYNSDYFVRPFVSICYHPVSFAPRPEEVECVLQLPMELLITNLQLGQQVFSRGSVQWTAPTIEFANAVVWGATAIILGELSELLQDGVYKQKNRFK